jgi:type IV pilus biogenesis protein CpaD/CtpE
MIDHTEEILEDLKFERMLSEKQHKSLIKSLNEVSIVLARVERANVETAKVMNDFLSKLKEMSAPNITVQAPNVSVNNDAIGVEIAKLAKQIADTISVVPTTLQPETKKEYVFEIIRNHGGVITSVKAKQK